VRTLLALCPLLLLAAPAVQAAPGDTTWVSTFSQEFINWATPHYGTFTLPAEPANWQKVVARLTIECPGSPNDCDPWDRLGHLRLVTPDQGDIELARFITPYDITGTGYPGSCTWTHNVTPWKSLLQGVVRLWGDDHLEYGNPANSIADQIPAMDIDIPADVTKVEVAVFATGHGQGNTGNCAEFCRKEHTVIADATAFSHLLWRSNCNINPCAPQGGTWTFSRAGWCPGAPAQPWKVDVTSAVLPGTTASLAYDVEAYENLCRPDNPDCVDGQTCAVCAYNGGGHTTPHYTLQAAVILYKDRSNVVTVDLSDLRTDDGLALGPASPNPFAPSTRFEYTVPRGGTVQLLIYDAAGRIVQDESRVHATAGTHEFRWDGRDTQGRIVAAGVYFYSVRMDGRSESRKMIRIH